MKYDHKKIENKWQKFWETNKTFKVSIDQSKPKYYVLDMFPYISGAGLHVGHVLGYTATDILARYKRQKGFNVLHPMGWDSFGLPAEQHAIRTGTHPAKTTEKNLNNFRKQLKSLGFSYDWDREFGTHEPTYYKWTQWIFTKLFEKGLAYEADLPVNWCEALGTVLANEEVEDGKSKEGGHKVIRKPLKQWVLKITAYADRLLQDLDLLDWPESLKRLQRNWIGKSVGAEVYFDVDKAENTKISVFTTRPDTLFGATYMVLAPEHPLVDRITTKENVDAVKAYQEDTSLKSDIDRTDLSKEKTGVFTGAFAINPANQEKIPIWISDYVLVGYGTGAIMAVPSHDERDFDFAKVHDLKIQPVFDPNTKELQETLDNSTLLEEKKQSILNGNACWSGTGSCINSCNQEVSLNGLSVEDAIKTITQWLTQKGYGKQAISYKLRDWLFSRQRYWGEPFPILHLKDGTTKTLGIDELPLTPPDISDFKPSGDGQSPIAKVDGWVNTIDKETGIQATRETNTMPQWAGSCWYYLRFCDPHNNDEAFSPDAENYWMPVDLYVGGVEHAVLHLLYARFWHKVLFDAGYVSTKEPFQSLRNQGLIVSRSYKNQKNQYVVPTDVIEKNGNYTHKDTGEILKSQIEKMSKSKLNGVVPDDIIHEYGSDALRLYEMFMGPLDKEKVWNTDAVNGCRRFLQRFYDVCTSDKVTDSENEQALKLGHRLVDNVEKDIEAMSYNTSVARFMEFINDFIKLEFYPKSVLKMTIQALSPFCPHIAEELYEHLGFKEPLSYARWPLVDKKYLTDDSVVYVVQVNGKVRGRMEMKKGLSKEELLELAQSDESVIKHIEGKELRKVIFVPNKLLNLVV